MRGSSTATSTRPAVSRRSTSPMASTRRVALLLAQRREQRPRPARRCAVDPARAPRGPALVRLDRPYAAVGRVGLDDDQAVGLERAEQPAQVARVQVRARARSERGVGRRRRRSPTSRARRRAAGRGPGTRPAATPSALGHGPVERANARQASRPFSDLSQRSGLSGNRGGVAQRHDAVADGQRIAALDVERHLDPGQVVVARVGYPARVRVGDRVGLAALHLERDRAGQHAASSSARAPVGQAVGQEQPRVLAHRAADRFRPWPNQTVPV